MQTQKQQNKQLDLKMVVQQDVSLSKWKSCILIHFSFIHLNCVEQQQLEVTAKSMVSSLPESSYKKV